MSFCKSAKYWFLLSIVLLIVAVYFGMNAYSFSQQGFEYSPLESAEEILTIEAAELDDSEEAQYKDPYPTLELELSPGKYVITLSNEDYVKRPFVGFFEIIHLQDRINLDFEDYGEDIAWMFEAPEAGMYRFLLPVARLPFPLEEGVKESDFSDLSLKRITSLGNIATIDFWKFTRWTFLFGAIGLMIFLLTLLLALMKCWSKRIPILNKLKICTFRKLLYLLGITSFAAMVFVWLAGLGAADDFELMIMNESGTEVPFIEAIDLDAETEVELTEGLYVIWADHLEYLSEHGSSYVDINIQSANSDQLINTKFIRFGERFRLPKSGWQFDIGQSGKYKISSQVLEEDKVAKVRLVKNNVAEWVRYFLDIFTIVTILFAILGIGIIFSTYWNCTRYDPNANYLKDAIT